MSVNASWNTAISHPGPVRLEAAVKKRLANVANVANRAILLVMPSAAFPQHMWLRCNVVLPAWNAPREGITPRDRCKSNRRDAVSSPGCSWHGICLLVHSKFRVRIHRWIDSMQTALHSIPTTPRTIPRRLMRPSQRRATVVLEFVLVLPILVFVLVGTVLFGVFYANMQQVSLAARVGAVEASQTALGGSDGDPVPANVLAAITQQLETSGLTYCRVRLEHNVGVPVGDPPVELSSTIGTACCVGGPAAKLPIGTLPHEYVRLTVVLNLTEVMPDNIGCFCYSPASADKSAFATTILRYEL